MRILTITYYKDFARYFLYLEAEFRKIVPGAEFTRLALYPCAKSHFNANGVDATLLPYALPKSQSIPQSREIYRGYKLDDLISYSTKALNDNTPSTLNALRLRACRYIDYYEDLFSRDEFDFIICSGDTRIPVEACIAVARKFKIKIWYFEQGPFGTTILDDQGVNTHVSFSGKIGTATRLNDIRLDEHLALMRKASGGNHWKNKQKSLKDYPTDLATLLLLNPPRVAKHVLPLELSSGVRLQTFVFRTVTNKLSRLIKKKRRTELEKIREPYIALLLQVPHDAQMLVHSPHYSDITTLVKDVVNNVPAGFSVHVREHPLHAGRYDASMYKFIQSSDSACIDNDSSLDAMLDGATSVVVNNSTSGLDAMLRSKTVVLLGNAYYANDSIVYQLKDRKLLHAVLYDSVTKPISQTSLTQYLKWLIGENLLPGHFQDENLTNAPPMIYKMLSH